MLLPRSAVHRLQRRQRSGRHRGGARVGGRQLPAAGSGKSLSNVVRHFELNSHSLLAKQFGFTFQNMVNIL